MTMGDRTFLQLEKTFILKDGRPLDGAFEVWFTEEGIYFLHYFSAKKDFYENVRERQWGLKPAERLRESAGSFFAARGEIVDRGVHPLHVKFVSGAFTTGGYHTHVLVLKTSEGRTLELRNDRIKDLLGDLEIYFSGGSVFKAEEFANHGLDIGCPAPTAFASMLAEKNVEPPFPERTLEDMVANREYMRRFWIQFSMKVPREKKLEVLEYMMDRFPAKFREEILDRSRKGGDPRNKGITAAVLILGVTALGSIFILKPLILKIASGAFGLLFVSLGFLFRSIVRQESRIYCELLRKYG
jgi:hypothetical protein